MPYETLRPSQRMAHFLTHQERSRWSLTWKEIT